MALLFALKMASHFLSATAIYFATAATHSEARVPTNPQSTDTDRASDFFKQSLQEAIGLLSHYDGVLAPNYLRTTQGWEKNQDRWDKALFKTQASSSPFTLLADLQDGLQSVQVIQSSTPLYLNDQPKMAINDVRTHTIHVSPTFQFEKSFANRTERMLFAVHEYLGALHGMDRDYAVTEIIRSFLTEELIQSSEAKTARMVLDTLFSHQLRIYFEAIQALGAQAGGLANLTDNECFKIPTNGNKKRISLRNENQEWRTCWPVLKRYLRDTLHFAGSVQPDITGVRDTMVSQGTALLGRLDCKKQSVDPTCEDIAAFNREVMAIDLRKHPEYFGLLQVQHEALSQQFQKLEPIANTIQSVAIASLLQRNADRLNTYFLWVQRKLLQRSRQANRISDASWQTGTAETIQDCTFTEVQPSRILHCQFQQTILRNQAMRAILEESLAELQSIFDQSQRMVFLLPDYSQPLLQRD